MSALTHLFLLTFIDLLWIISGNEFICTDTYCKCLDPAGCHVLCKNGFCQNKEFVCTKNINHCSFNCQEEQESCQNSTFYIASNDFNINCSSKNSCNNIEIYCGKPQQLPIQTSINDFTQNMQTCAISVSDSAIQNSYISCNGNIENCYINSEPNTNGTVFDSEFDCSVTNGQCEFNCSNSCYRSLYSCHITDISECICNDCIQKDGVTILNAENTDNTHMSSTINKDIDYLNDDIDSSFNPTDNEISNLDILYYIIVGAGGCLCCYICICITIICLIRSSMKRNKHNKHNKHKSVPSSKDKINTTSTSDIGSS
eukprot:279321_1